MYPIKNLVFEGGGILGVAYSSIYIREEYGLVLKATNATEHSFNIYDNEFRDKIESGKSFVINCESTGFCRLCEKNKIRSIIGTPVILGH
jgi:hypothetical protein